MKVVGNVDNWVVVYGDIVNDEGVGYIDSVEMNFGIFVSSY